MLLPIELRNRIIEFLVRYPDIHTVNGRRALIYSASLNEYLQRRIQFEGTTNEFCQLLVTQLLEDGRNTLKVVLAAVKDTVGKDWREYYEVLINDLQKFWRETPGLNLHAPQISDQRLLPYLSDRSDQEYELTKALQYYKENVPRRPFICIIHGNQQECHEMFLERLRSITLPQFLNINTYQLSIGEPWYVEWPLRDIKLINRLSKLHYHLACKIVGRGHVTTETIAETLVQYKKPCMICTRLLTQDWQENETDLIENWLKFWNDDWPDMVPGQLLFIFIIVIYENTVERSFFQKLFKKRQIIDEVKDFISQINYQAYNNLYGVTLPELKSISRSEAEHWVLYWVPRFAPALCNTQDLLNEIQQLYEYSSNLTHEGYLPMQKLACKLIGLMTELSHR